MNCFKKLYWRLINILSTTVLSISDKFYDYHIYLSELEDENNEYY